MKKRVLLLSLILGSMLFACGCKSTPDDKMVKEDIQQAIYNCLENALFELSDYEVVQSTTDEKEYEAEYQATAKSKNATLDFSVHCSYHKYDQGWKVDATSAHLDIVSEVEWPKGQYGCTL